MGQFLQELKRRNVFRVGAAYVVVSWLIIQVIETVSEPLGLPDWTEAFFIVVLLAGLPVIVMFAWAFELTPEGLKKTRDVDAAESVTADTGKRLNYAIIVVLVMALGYFLWERQGLVEKAEEPTPVADVSEEVTQTGTASIAVLPFVNMSADPEQEYFSDGISEELLNLLAQIPDLRVPARTSSFQFKGRNLDIGEVARQLNVRHVLEGSVRKADVRVRVTAQLIEADTGYHLWSDTYDRELDDIFAIQDEISAAIVAALSDTLGLQADEVPHARSAANQEAYNAFLLAQHQMQKRTLQDIQAAVGNYDRALEFDPDYAPAHAGLGLAWYLQTASGSTYGTLPLEESLGKALPHIERALELDGNLPEALGVMGLTLDARSRFEESVTYYEKALALNPSLTDVRNWYSQALQALGRLDDSMHQMEVAYETDPLSVLTLNNYTNKLLARRRFDRMEPLLERLAQLDPARGASFRGHMLTVQGRAAEGVEQALRAVEFDMANVRLLSQAARGLWDLGHKDAAIRIWPYPDNLLPLVQNDSDLEYVLALAREQYARDPDNPVVKDQLAWALWDAGDEEDREEALRLGTEYLGTLGETRRPIDGTNMIFALDARRRGDEEAMLARLEPLEASLDRVIEDGVVFPWVRLSKAFCLQLRGDSEAAFDMLEEALASGRLSVESVDWFFRSADWGERPEFLELQDRHRRFIGQEHDKLLRVACGPDGFEVWRPSEDSCARLAETT